MIKLQAFNEYGFDYTVATANLTSELVDQVTAARVVPQVVVWITDG
jgi:hypothetical protein